MPLLSLLAIPTLIAVMVKFWLRGTVTWGEFVMQTAVQTAVVSAGYAVARHQSMEDVEHLHGRVTGKIHGSEKCCHCRQVCSVHTTKCSKKGGCRTECMAYREECDHARDYYWSLDTTVGTMTIDSCEPNHRRVPEAWRMAYVGEPASAEHRYTNYLKADRESLLVHRRKDGFRVPEFPKIYGVYHVNPVVGDAEVPAEWSRAIKEVNADIGSRKQVDVNVLATRVQDPAYAQAVEAEWAYGPKNSLNVVIGVADERITWARVVTFSKVEDLSIYLRDELQGKSLRDDVPGIIRSAVTERFRRTDMANYEYLARAARPSRSWMITLHAIGVALAAALAAAMHKNEIFGERAKKRTGREHGV